MNYKRYRSVSANYSTSVNMYKTARYKWPAREHSRDRDGVNQRIKQLHGVHADLYASPLNKVLQKSVTSPG
jgi:hypothetical protein